MTALYNDDNVEVNETHFLTRDAWRTWTPTVDQGGAVTFTNNRSKYIIFGNTAIIMAELTMTGAGVAATAIEVGGVPTVAQPAGLLGSRSVVGIFTLLDSGAQLFNGVITTLTVSSFQFRDGNTRALVGANPNFALAAGDIISLRAFYEVDIS